MSECLTWPTNAAHVPSANGSTILYREIRSMLDAPAAAEYFEDQLPPVAPLDVSLPLLHPCCGCVAVTLSVSILLTVHWLAEILRLTAMDGRSIDLAAHQKGTFFHRKLILITPHLLFFLAFPHTPPNPSFLDLFYLRVGWPARWLARLAECHVPLCIRSSRNGIQASKRSEKYIH